MEDGFVYVGTESGRFLALRADTISTGETLDLEGYRPDASKDEWQFPPVADEFGGAVYGTAALSAERVFTAQNRDGRTDGVGQINAFHRVSDESQRAGELIWCFLTEGRLFGSPVLYEGNIYVADDEGIVYALNASADSSDNPNDDPSICQRDNVVWQEEIGTKRFWSTPALSEGVLYIGSMDKGLYALDASSGDVKWAFKAGGAIVSTPLVLGDVLYVGAFDGKFYAIDRSNGEQIWEFDGDGWFWNDAIANGEGTVVYVGSLGGSFYAFNAQTGREIWRAEVGSKVRATAVIVGERILVVARNGALLTVDINTGRRTRSNPLDAKALASPAWDGKSFYVFDQDQILHKFAAEE